MPAARVQRHSLGSTAVALLFSFGVLLLGHANASAQRTQIDPRSVSLKVADLPRGFTLIESQTAFEPLRTAPEASGGSVVGAIFKTVMERPQTLENLQS